MEGYNVELLPKKPVIEDSAIPTGKYDAMIYDCDGADGTLAEWLVELRSYPACDQTPLMLLSADGEGVEGHLDPRIQCMRKDDRSGILMSLGHMIQSLESEAA